MYGTGLWVYILIISYQFVYTCIDVAKNRLFGILLLEIFWECNLLHAHAYTSSLSAAYVYVYYGRWFIPGKKYGHVDRRWVLI